MNNLTLERIAEIKAFNDIDISYCPELTDDQLKMMKPRYPNSLKSIKEDVQICLDADVIAWFKQYGENYQNKINAVLRESMLQQNI